MNRRSLIFTIFCISLSHAAELPYYIVIHGTWSQQFDWHMPGGDFYDALASATSLGTVSFFHWSGKNSHAARVEASKNLVEYIQMHYPKDAHIHIVSHSHGSNVGILASQELAKQPDNQHHIHRFYALGTPVSSTSYMPDMSIIKQFYNFFSFNDFVQPVFGLFEREYPEHPRIANIAITIDGKEPQHSELHHPLIAQWLPKIHTIFDPLELNKPATISFETNKPPHYAIDLERSAKKNRDQKIIYSLNNLHWEMRKKSSTYHFSFLKKNNS